MLMVAREISAEEFKSLAHTEPRDATNEEIVKEMNSVIDNVYYELGRLERLVKQLDK